MNLAQIEEESRKESIEVSPYVSEIIKTIDLYPNGTDLTFPRWVLPRLILECDKRKIPCYHVAEDCVSVAANYSRLLAREKMR